MKPIIPPKYDIGFMIKNCNDQLLESLEPWCSTIYVDCDYDSYVKREQINTQYDLLDRVKDLDSQYTQGANNIIVEIDGTRFGNEDFRFIQHFSEIIANDKELEIGTFQLGNLQITINSLETYENELIICES